jgi:Na+/melibiose symporter-like transporter
MLKLRQILCLASGGFAVGVVVALSSGVGQLSMKLHTSSTLLIGMVIGVAWFSGVIIPPLVGLLSDNTRTKYGRRIPYLMVFIPLTGIMMLITSLFVGANTVEVGSIESNQNYFVKVIDVTSTAEGEYAINLSLGSYKEADIKEMKISLDPGFKEAEWETYTNPKTLTASSYEEGQPVYARFRIYTGLAPGWALPLLAVAIIMTTILYNIWNAVYWALMPDITIPEERGKASGAMQAFNIVGAIVAMGASGALWDTNPAYAFYLFGFLIIVTGCVTAFGIKEREMVRRKGMDIEQEEKAKLREMVKDFFGAKEFAKFAFVTGFPWFAMGTFSTFFVLYATNYLKLEEGTSLILMGVFTIVMVMAAVPLGIFADKIRNKKKILSLGLLLGVCSIPIAWFVTEPIYVYPIMLAAGIAFGAITVCNQAIQSDLLPMGKEGEFLGVGTIFMALPMMLASFIVGAIITALGNDYRVIWIIAPIFLLIALILVQRVDTTPVHK